MSRYERKIKDGAAPFLEDGEEVLAAVIAAPRGYTQSVAGSMNLGSAQQGRAAGAAEQVDLRLEAPMALALTQRRLEANAASGARSLAEAFERTRAVQV